MPVTISVCEGAGKEVPHVRTLLIHSARSTLRRAKAGHRESNPEQLWMCSLEGRLPFGTVLVAIANKHARHI